MTTTKKSKNTRTRRSIAPVPPTLMGAPCIYGDRTILQHWLKHYWQKLQLPEHELTHLAITQDRQEFMRWTGKRLNLMTLGCYCYVTMAQALRKEYWHLIFIEPDLQPKSIEVTVAHELIHLADRVNGTPRKHRHHGYDSIAADEAAVTGYGLEELRALLFEESKRREEMRRARRPIRYIYECPSCGKQYPRTRRYSRPVSCSNCDKHYNPQFRLQESNAASA